MDSPSLSDTGLILVLLLSAVRGKKVRNIPKRVVKVVQTFANPVNAEQRRKWKQKITSTLTHICSKEYIAPICDGRGFPMVTVSKNDCKLIPKMVKWMQILVTTFHDIDDYEEAIAIAFRSVPIKSYEYNRALSILRQVNLFERTRISRGTTVL